MRRLLLITLVTNVQSKDLGTFGETFPIKEQSPIEYIEEKLSKLRDGGSLEAHQKIIRDRVQKKIMNPDPVGGINKAKADRSFFFDPSIVAPYDLKDHKGTVFHKKGTKVNPLEIRALTKPLLIIDGEDKEQMTWALDQYKENPRAKIILIRGSAFKLSEIHGVDFYFDQYGLLTKKFGINEVPARITQRENKFFIEIINLYK